MYFNSGCCGIVGVLYFSQVNIFLKEQDDTSFTPMTVQEVALGFIEVANETMCRPIRALTQVSYIVVYWVFAALFLSVWVNILCFSSYCNVSA